jgi:ferredoxin-NADP reductase
VSAHPDHALAGNFSSRLIRQEAAARQTGTFYFEKPTGFSFTAGQFVDITLPVTGVPDLDRIHSFTISSAPYEDHLAITTRLRDSPFKRALRALGPGDAIDVEGPYGAFVISPDIPRPIAFLAGGVGVTPASSIVKQAARDGTLADVYLFYSNRTRDDAPFLTEFGRLQAAHSGFHLIAAMTEDPSWPGEKERIGIEMIRRYLDPLGTSFYVSGPPAMVAAMREMLTGAGVGRDRIKVENFSGY